MVENTADTPGSVSESESDANSERIIRKGQTMYFVYFVLPFSIPESRMKLWPAGTIMTWILSLSF